MSAPKQRIRCPVCVVFGHGRRNRRVSLSRAIADGLVFRTTARELQGPEARWRKATRQPPASASNSSGAFLALTIVSGMSSEARRFPYELSLFLGEEQHWSFAIVHFFE